MNKTINSKPRLTASRGFFLAIHIIVPIFLTGRKKKFFDDFIYQDVIFHYNIVKAFFAILLKGTEHGRSEKAQYYE